jgi:hypothetical protein
MFECVEFDEFACDEVETEPRPAVECQWREIRQRRVSIRRFGVLRPEANTNIESQTFLHVFMHFPF